MKSASGFLLVLVIFSFSVLANSSVVSNADNIRPLLTGQFVANAKVKTSFGGDIKLLSLIEKKPSVILFYRGGFLRF